MNMLKIGQYLARGVLFLLVFIHWVLPFTPANQHSELRIIFASAILGTAFLAIAIKSIRQPGRYFTAGLLLLLIVYAISALSGASPLKEGLVIKVLFVIFIAFGIISDRLAGSSEIGWSAGG